MIATQRVTSDDLELLAGMRRDRIARERPQQLAERQRLVATLTPTPAALKEKAEIAAAVATAMRGGAAAHRALEHARDQLSAAWRREHGHSHGVNGLDQDARARLRATTHPAVAVVWKALIRAGFDAMAVPLSVVAIEHIKEDVEPSAEAARRWWQRPAVHEEIRATTSHAVQVAFLEALSAARPAVEDLAYRRLDDDDVVARLRDEIDAVLTVAVPSGALHVREELAALRRTLNRNAIDLYDEEPAPWWGAEGVSA